VRGEPLFGGTADIDLILVHKNPPTTIGHPTTSPAACGLLPGSGPLSTTPYSYSTRNISSSGLRLRPEVNSTERTTARLGRPVYWPRLVARSVS
jgi:hypothetical protein